ncbi:MAG: PHB depolymerase family esterase [Candidatus Obscuribacter sp.]|nr:hypothetical protein [Candidatus Melainabacteria bacterium]MDX1985466.1 PHB depolymerase family esterase [Candidatus Obscuribacter sp.]
MPIDTPTAATAADALPELSLNAGNSDQSLFLRVMDEVRPARASEAKESRSESQSQLEAPRPGETSIEKIILADGSEAPYRLHVPKDYDGKTPLPVVFMFHGYGIRRGQGDTDKGARGMEEVSGLSKLADREKFIAVYPDGNPQSSYSWNNGQWFFSGRDDKALTSGIMDTLKEKLNVDENRMYIIGYSQGGSFSHRVANELSERVAAVVENGGWMTGKEKQPDKPFPIMSIQSKTDGTVPIDGNPWYSITMKPEVYTQDFYKRAHGIEGAPEVAKRMGKDGTEVEELVWKARSGAEVKTMLLNDQKHLWYGGKGAEVAPINTTEEAWNFLKRFSRQQ